MSANEESIDDPAALLAKARERAEALLKQLLAEQAEVEANPPKIPAEDIAAGREAMTKAVEAARRTVAAIEAAIASAGDDLPGG